MDTNLNPAYPPTLLGVAVRNRAPRPGRPPAPSVGEALGAGFAIDVDQRIAGAAAVGAHKTSMLQDLEQGRPMEIDAIVGAVRELGSMVGIETPTIDHLFALVVARARTAGCYR